ncbi:MAG: hypothetical protein N2Z76_08105 [Treponemataceae bacterium]|nr:hypothetical protein [Treponemataceae bacterium]
MPTVQSGWKKIYQILQAAVEEFGQRFSMKSTLDIIRGFFLPGHIRGRRIDYEDPEVKNEDTVVVYGNMLCYGDRIGCGRGGQR